MIVAPAVAAAATAARQNPNQAKRLRAQALSAQFGDALKSTKSTTLGEYVITVDSVQISGDVVHLRGVTVSRLGVDLGIDPHQAFVNPPLLFPDTAGSQSITVNGVATKFRVDPAAVILVELLGQVS